MARVARRVQDQRVLKRLRAYLHAGVMVNGVVREAAEGTPQGGPLSPLLANILLDDLDRELEQRGHRFIRYADDCNIDVRSPRAGERVLASVTRFIERRLKLRVNDGKSAMDRAIRRSVLGFSFLPGRTVKIRIAPRALQKAKATIRELTRRRRSQRLRTRVQALNEYLRGWIGCVALAETPSVIDDLEPMGPPTLADVPVAAMAASAHSIPTTARIRGAEARCAADRQHRTGTMADRRESPRSMARYRLLGPARSGECDRDVRPSSIDLVNRRMRTRMSGGVEGE